MNGSRLRDVARHRYWLRGAIIGAIASIGALVLLGSGGGERRIEIDPAAITFRAGHAYEVVPGATVGFPYRLVSNSFAEPRRSRLQLFEDAALLGPAYALRKASEDDGRGAYSYWDNTLIFSASDGSDPRVNGRRYQVVAPVMVVPWLRYGLKFIAITAVLLTVVASGSLGWAWRRFGHLLDFGAPRLHRRRMSLFAVCLVVLVAGLELRSPILELPLDPAAMLHANGSAYSIDFPRDIRWPYVIAADDPRHALRSKLQLYEGTQALGPAHALHTSIAEHGGGYSHWRDDLLFASSDGSDPRSNGRSYFALVPAHIDLGVWYTSIAILSLTLGISYLGRGLEIARAVSLPMPTPLARGPALSVVLATIALACGWVVMRWLTGHGPGLSLSGYLPLSDAIDYTTCAKQIAGFGEVTQAQGFCMRRALYPSFLGGLLVATDYDWQYVLLLQAVLVGLALGLAVLALLRSAGLLGTLIATGVLLAFAREHVLSQFMTEFAGFTFGLLTLVLILRLARDERRGAVVAMLATFSLGMVSRVGALFSLPAAGLGVLWIIWRGPRTGRFRWSALAGAALLTGFLMQSLLSVSVNLPVSGTFGNFSTVLYRLSVGAVGYNQAYKDLPELMGAGPEQEAFRKLYSIAFANIVASPEVFAAALGRAVKSYGWSLFSLDIIEQWREVLALLLLIGLLDCAWHWRDPARLMLLLIALGEIASGPFIVEDGGLRLFATTFPVRAAVVAFGVAAVLRIALALIDVGERALGDASRQSATNGSIARPSDERAAQVALAVAVAMLAIMVLPLTPLAGPRRMTVLKGHGCDAGDISFAVQLDRESMNMMLVGDASSARMRPLRSWRAPVLDAVSGAWYADSVEALPVPVLLVQLTQRGEVEFGHNTRLILPLRTLEPLPRAAVFCTRPDAETELGGAPYYVAHAMHPLTLPEGRQ